MKNESAVSMVKVDGNSLEKVEAMDAGVSSVGRWGGHGSARRPRGHRLERGVTLIEVMIVVVILGLIAGGVAVAVFPKFKEAQIKTTKTSAMELRRATEMWRGTHASDECPTVEQLRADKAFDTASKLTDAWDMPFKIACDSDETIVSSNGPDKKEGTADDIRVPDLQADQK